MNRSKLFGSLPYSLQCLFANLWSLYLKWWRYGPETETLIQEIFQHEKWNPQKIFEYQEEIISRLLHHSATKIPFYQNYWNIQRQKGNHSSWERLENWPVLKKEEVRKNPYAFVNPDHSCLYREHTSGSTGTPLTLFQNRKTLHYWYALHETRLHRWYGFNKNNNWAIIGGQLIQPVSKTKPPFWIWNQVLNQLYLSSYHISQNNTPEYVEVMRKYKIKYLLGYPSAITNLAEFILDHKIEDFKIEMVFCNAELLFDYQREVISKAFHCPVVNTYGMSELVCGASECEFGVMHIWPEAGVIEILDENYIDKLQDRTIGKIIATGLLNFDMPLIRYDTGDRGSVANGSCKCGREFHVLEKIEGRCDDVIITPDGRKIGRLDPVFKTDIPIQEAQIHQYRIDEVIVKYIPGEGYNHDELLTQRLRERLGTINIHLEPVNFIPKGPNGKFKAVVSTVNK